MACVRCDRKISENAAFCEFCGADQHPPPPTDDTGRRLLRRSRVDRQIAGVCGGIARYFDTDPVFVRVAWVLVTIVPGAILLGVLAYVVSWMVMPEAVATEAVTIGGAGATGHPRRLRRSTHDAKIAGVCGGLAEYFQVDSTAVRVVVVILSIFPGAIVCGVLTYIVAWFIMPRAPLPLVPPAEPEPAPTGGAE